MRVSSSTVVLAAALGVIAPCPDRAFAVGPPMSLDLKVDAGAFDRENTPIRLEIPARQLGPALIRAVADGPVAPSLVETREDGTEPRPVPAQLEVVPGDPDGRHRLTFVLQGRTPAGARRSFRLATERAQTDQPSPWSIFDREAGVLELKNRDRSVFRYNASPVSHPNHGAIQRRDAYIHPVFTPSGALITGDFSRFHPHHRGFFLAYTRTQVGGARPDFWNIHNGKGKIFFEALDSRQAGAVTARFVTRHRWDATGAGAVLRERWEVEAFDIPGQPYWLFDLTASQQATGAPLELQPYRYGGMAYRGPEPFVKGVLDVRTSEGLGRKDGDQKPARWVDLTGPVEEGSQVYGGAMIADHPSNANHPTVARIHPTSLPFFTFVPGYRNTVVIGPDAPTVFRYRILIHDGHPDPERDERIWRDFAEPPRVVVTEAPTP